MHTSKQAIHFTLREEKKREKKEREKKINV